MDLIPAAGNARLKVACPPFRVTTPMVVAPFIKLTVPDGTAPEGLATLAVKVTI